jgi:hypothetical protein
MEAMGGEALGLVSASASDRSGGRIGGHTGGDTGDPMPMATPMATPMAMRTRRWLPPHRPRSISDPHPRRPFSLLHQPRGITVTTHGGITPTCSNVQGDGDQSPPRRHKPEAVSLRAHHPTRVSSVPTCDKGGLTPHQWALTVWQPGEVGCIRGQAGVGWATGSRRSNVIDQGLICLPYRVLARNAMSYCFP